MTTRRSPALPRTARTARRAFTLLELLLSLILMGMLMAGVWAMAAMYARAFSKGDRQVERAQIVRSVGQMLTDDLESAIQDPGNKYIRPEKGLAQVRRFGLVGTRTKLQIDVLQMNPFDATAEPNASNAGFDTSAPLPGMEANDADKPKQVPELTTIYYTFTDPLASSDLSGKNRPGLTRRSLAFETPVETDTTSDLTTGTIQSPLDTSTDATYDGATAQADSVIDLLAMEPDTAETWAPEVVDLRFRYYDGNSWRGSWNSVKQKALPVAIEATIRVVTLADVEKLRTASAARGKRVSLTSVLDDTPMERRLVINLPGTPLKRPTRPTAQRPRPSVPRPPRPAPAATTSPKPPNRPADGLLRTGT